MPLAAEAPPQDLLTIGAVCEPFVCPGTFAPIDTPSEVLLREIVDVERLVPAEDRKALLASGFATKPVAPPADWTFERRAAAQHWMQLTAEALARQNVKLYSPWTSDLVCGECPGWLRPGSVVIGPKHRKPVPPGAEGGPGWSWKGVRAVESQQPGQKGSWIITCGMLRDAGVVSSRDDCDRERGAARAQYEGQVAQMVHRVRQGTKSRGVHATVYKIIADVAYGITVAFVPIVAVLAPIHESHTRLASKMIVGEYGDVEILPQDAEEFFRTVHSVIGQSMPVVGQVGSIVKAVVDLSLAAYDLVKAIDAREEAKEDLRAKRAEVEAMNAELARMIEDRAAIEDLWAAVQAGWRKVDEGKALLGSPAAETIPTLAWAGLALALALVLGGRR